MTACDARCLVWSPRASLSRTAGVASCNLDAGHSGEHQSSGVVEDGKRWPTAVMWMEDDRRTFRGELALCPDPSCYLPAGHPRHHAY